MKTMVTDMNQEATIRAFDKQAPIFDELYSNNAIVRYKRQRVRDHMAKYLAAHSNILELNSGTGDDAIYFALQGHRIHATDVSPKMQEIMREKIIAGKLQENISIELCSFTQLETLKQPGPYDHIFSNFAGLNCTDQLGKVLSSFDRLLKPGGYVTLVVLPKFCLWEFMLLFKGKFKTAFRRFSGKKGSRAHIEGEYFRCWYYNPSFIRKQLKKNFKVVSLEGLCTIVPPSYIESFAEKHPKWYGRLVRRENKRKDKWPWKVVGDYYIITFQKSL